MALRQALLRHPENFVNTFTVRLLTYALGRGLDYRDMPTVRRIVNDSQGKNYQFSSIVLGIVKSLPFQMRFRRRRPMGSRANSTELSLGNRTRRSRYVHY